MSTASVLKFNSTNKLIILSLVLLAVIYQSTILKLVKSWSYDWNSHGVLLFFICVYIFFKSLKIHGDRLSISKNILGLSLLLLLSIIWLLANLIFVRYVELVSLPIIFLCLLISLLGWQQSKPFWFPVLLMLLAGPLLSLLTPILQNITAVSTGVLLQLTNITSLVDGVLILVPAGTFEVDTGCSGLNVLTVGIILSLLYSYINVFKIKYALVLLVASISLSVFSNIIRVYIIVMVGNATQMQHSLVKDHGDLGWAVFVVIFGAFLYFVHRLKIRYDSHEHAPALNPADNKTVNEATENSLKNLLVVVFSLLAASVGPLFLLYSSARSESLIPDNSFHPPTIRGWQLVEDNKYDWKTHYRAGKGDRHITQTYQSGSNGTVYLDIRYFSQQNVGNEAVNTTNSVYERDKWTRVWIESYSLEGDAGAGIDRVEETLIRDNRNHEMLIWRWYFTNGKKTGNAYKAKIYNLLGVLTGRPEISSYVVAASVVNNYKETRMKMLGFVNASNGALYYKR